MKNPKNAEFRFDKLTKRIEQNSGIFLRFGLFANFIYFGLIGVLNPVQQYELWIHPALQPVIPVGLIFLFSTVEVIIAIMFLVGYKIRFASTIASVLLIGIIINLGLTEIALRDFAILTAVIYLCAKDYELEDKYSIVKT